MSSYAVWTCKPEARAAVQLIGGEGEIALEVNQKSRDSRAGQVGDRINLGEEVVPKVLVLLDPLPDLRVEPRERATFMIGRHPSWRSRPTKSNASMELTMVPTRRQGRCLQAPPCVIGRRE